MAGRRPRRPPNEISKSKSPAERRAQIFAAARALIEEQGLAYVTMERVASQAGVSKPVVYGQFKNRGALLVALLEQFWDDIDSQLAPDKLASPDLDVFTSALITAYFDALERGGPALQAVAASGSEEPEVNQARLERFERIEHIWSAKYTKSLGLAPETAAVAAATLRSAIAGAGAFWMEHQGATRESCVKVCTSVVRGALSELKVLAG
jgi:AcrR family transcriptional regulator